MEESILKAIDDSYEAMDELYRKIIHIIGEMNITQIELNKTAVGQRELSDRCVGELKNFESEIRDLFARKRESLESFNIAFFLIVFSSFFSRFFFSFFFSFYIVFFIVT